MKKKKKSSEVKLLPDLHKESKLRTEPLSKSNSVQTFHWFVVLITQAREVVVIDSF